MDVKSNFTSWPWSLTAGSPSKTMCMVLSPVSLKNYYFENGEACLCGHLCIASLLLCICSPNPWVFSPMWGSAAECHLQLLGRQVYSVARLCPDQTFLSLCHRRHVAALCMLHKVNSNLNNCLFRELPSASVRVLSSIRVWSIKV